MKDVRRGERKLAWANHSIGRMRRLLARALDQGGEVRDDLVARIVGTRHYAARLRADLERRRSLDQPRDVWVPEGLEATGWDPASGAQDGWAEAA